MCSLRVKPLEYQATGVTEEVMHANHPQKKDGVIVVSLNALAFTSWTLHEPILTIAGVRPTPIVPLCGFAQKANSSSRRDEMFIETPDPTSLPLL